jgi:hypothetical protein
MGLQGGLDNMVGRQTTLSQSMRLVRPKEFLLGTVCGGQAIYWSLRARTHAPQATRGRYNLEWPMAVSASTPSGAVRMLFAFERARAHEALRSREGPIAASRQLAGTKLVGVVLLQTPNQDLDGKR